MPRISKIALNLNQPNIEQLEFTAEDINKWIDNPKSMKDVASKLEAALDEAQADILNETTEVQYVVIKITK